MMMKKNNLKINKKKNYLLYNTLEYNTSNTKDDNCALE